MTTRTTVIFGTVVSDIFDMRISPKRARFCQESFHDMKDINIDENCDTKDGCLEFSRM